MRKYGAFEVTKDNYVPYEKAVEGTVGEDGRIRADGKVVGVMVEGTARAGFNTPSRKLELLSETLLAWGWNTQDHVVPWP